MLALVLAAAVQTAAPAIEPAKPWSADARCAAALWPVVQERWENAARVDSVALTEPRPTATAPVVPRRNWDAPLEDAYYRYYVGAIDKARAAGEPNPVSLVAREMDAHAKALNEARRGISDKSRKGAAARPGHLDAYAKLTSGCSPILDRLAGRQ
jgi:hypothetical protein